MSVVDEKLMPFVSAMATLLTVGLFLVPFNDIQTFRRQRSVGQRPFLPFLSMLNNCIVWSVFEIRATKRS